MWARCSRDVLRHQRTKCENRAPAFLNIDPEENVADARLGGTTDRAVNVTDARLGVPQTGGGFNLTDARLGGDHRPGGERGRPPRGAGEAP